MKSLFLITAVLLGMLFVPAIESRGGGRAEEVPSACDAAKEQARRVCGRGTSGGTQAQGGGGKRSRAAAAAAAACLTNHYADNKQKKRSNSLNKPLTKVNNYEALFFSVKSHSIHISAR
ncbi:Hypothetical predicted protein [Mytilus galloprovincialis]|uniref:Uncharacterized protein n=1 Tax=Mytilus galloprovincialis TaxID=29158 RepID=A0A8B6CXC2_MYTGA|nr:Hypothetical predicted protein [Mytilus galloprovincialis]